MPAGPTTRPEPRARGRIRDLFLRLLGVVYVIAFGSLWIQLPVLLGSRGLSPVRDFLVEAPGLLAVPTVFWVDASDATLAGVALAGAAAGALLALGLAPRWCLAAIWVLYLSLASVGQDFLAFQWDNLLLETAVVALLVAPAGLRPRRAPSPHPLAVLLVLWLLFRLLFESGVAKLVGGDPTWRDLTAMATYWETAPLPTPLAWWAHQLPPGVQRAMGLLVYLSELVVPLLVFGPRRLAPIVFALLVTFQVGVLLTANYGIFNWLSILLALWVLDDAQLARAAAWCGVALVPSAPRPTRSRATGPLAVVAAVLITCSLIQFASLFRPLPTLAPLRRALLPFRSVNVYHLFARMTLVRREAVIEGSADGQTWHPYELRYQAGNPLRPPPIVAPHQPRVDFQMWFLLLGRRQSARWFDRLLSRLLTDPATVRPLLAVDPFPDAPPAAVRVAIWRYRFTPLGERAWWTRELEGHTRPLSAETAGPPGAQSSTGRQRPPCRTSRRGDTTPCPVLSG